MSTNRLNVIDVAKGIGIILVVFAHINYTPELLVLIYSFHMPLFFLISGMLYNKDRYPEFVPFLKRRIKTLMIPYVLYEMFSILCLYASERIYSHLNLFDISKEEYIEFFKQILISNWSGTHVNQPLWFVPCLFLVEVLYYFISKMEKRGIIPVCLLLVCCGWILESGFLEFDNKTLPWSLDSALFALGFYAIGNLSSEYVQKTIRKIKGSRYKYILCVEIIVLSILVWLPLTLMNGKITLGSKILGNGFLLYINGILGTIIVLTISILMEKSRFLTFCGRNSFYIMASHYIIRRFVMRPLYIMHRGHGYNREILSETIIPFLCVFSLSFLYTVLWTGFKKKRTAIAMR